MRHVLHCGVLLPFPSLRRFPILLVFSCIGFLSPDFLRAQGVVSADGQGASGIGGLDSPRGGASSGSGTGFNAPPSGFGQAGGPPNSSSSSATLWNHLLLDAFQFGIQSGNLSGGGDGLNGGGPGYGSGPNRSGTGAPGNSIDLNFLFRMASGVSSDLAAGKSGTLHTALGILPKFNQLARGGLNLPFNSSFGSFRLSYQNLVSGVGNTKVARIGEGSPSASFDSSHFRAGKIDFSAAAMLSGGTMGGGSGMSAGMSSFGGQPGGTTSFGAQTEGGGPAGGSKGSQGGGPGGPGGGNGGEKRPAASLSLRLSF